MSSAPMKHILELVNKIAKKDETSMHVVSHELASFCRALTDSTLLILILSV